MRLNIIGEPDKVTCILCRATVSHRNGDKARFLKHISIDHEVHYDTDLIYVVSFLSNDQKNMLINLISEQIKDPEKVHSEADTNANDEEEQLIKEELEELIRDSDFMADMVTDPSNVNKDKDISESSASKEHQPENSVNQKGTNIIIESISSKQLPKDRAINEDFFDEDGEDHVQDGKPNNPAVKPVTGTNIIIGSITSEQLAEDSIAENEDDLSDDDENDTQDEEPGNIVGVDPFAKVKCTKCDLMVPRKAMELHKKVKHNIKKSQMCCQYCNKTLHRGNFRRHMRVSHPVEDKKLEQERKINEKEKCKECDMMINRKVMGIHMKEHRDTKSVSSCQICNKTIYRGGMRHHMRTAHVMEDLEESPVENVSSTDADNLFLKCKHCLKLVRRTGYPKHLIESHTSVRISNCPLCSHGFSNKKNMLHHIEVIHKGKDLHYLDKDKKPKFTKEDCKFKCPDCEEKHISEVSLNFHITKNHGIRDYECERCQRKLTSKHNLNRHLEHCSRKIILS